MRAEITVPVLYFAGMRDKTGTSSDTFTLPNPCTSADILSCVSNSYPHLQELCKKSRVAVGHDFIDAAVELNERSEIAVIPPVSGG